MFTPPFYYISVPPTHDKGNFLKHLLCLLSHRVT